MREFSSTTTSSEQTGTPLDSIKFTLDGVEFTCNGQSASSFKISEMARQFRDGDDAAALAITAESFLMILGQEEYDRFVAHVLEHKTPDEVLQELGEYLGDETRKLTEAEADRP